MDELDLFRDFNRSVASPNEDARRRASASLTTTIEGERRPATRDLPRIRLRRAAIAPLALAAALGVVAVAALFIDSPWKSSPGFLQRAQAALTPPEGMILHAKWVVTRTSRDYGCTVTPGPDELWADLSTHRYRLIHRFLPSPLARDRRSMACVGSMTIETGGTPHGSLRFEPPDTLTYLGPGRVGAGSWDEVSNLREALAAGRAHDEGRTELDGRVVERIRIDCVNPPCSARRGYWYVDRETFLPVQFECLNCMRFSVQTGLLHFDVVERYLTYEYLPRTEANLALTDIRAQHPNATEVP